MDRPVDRVDRLIASINKPVIRADNPVDRLYRLFVRKDRFVMVDKPVARAERLVAKANKPVDRLNKMCAWVDIW